MKEQFHISAIIPTFNREKTIVRAIDSVLVQSYAPAEIIVVDDGSSDSTIEIIREYGEKVRYIYQNNAGIASARNRGVREAKCEWIAFLDSDDYWMPDHLKRITDAMSQTDGKAALYFSNIERSANRGGGTHWDSCDYRIHGSYELREDASEWAIMSNKKSQPMMLQASVIRRGKYLEVGGIPESLVTREDTYLFYLLGLFYPACSVSGLGAILSSDCQKSGRLTSVFDGKTETYHECTILLYRNLLRFRDKMNASHYKTIKSRYVSSYLNFGRVLLKKKRVFFALANFIKGIQLNPILATSSMLLMLKSYFNKRITTFQ
jgi:glycosyltransferase involved in cell wall biosynthesis